MAIAGVAALGGALLGHLTGAFPHAEVAREAGEAAHASAGWLPAVLATAATLLVFLALPRRISRRGLAVSLAAAPLIAFTLQEVLERVLSTGPSPFAMGHEPGILGSAVALLPWMLATFLVARAAVAIARMAGAGAGAGFVLVPPPLEPPCPYVVARADTGRHDSILDRPPRAPPVP